MTKNKLLATIFLSIAALTNATIIVNACFNDSLSGSISNSLSNFFIKIINHNRTEEATFIPVESIETVLSSEYTFNYIDGYAENEIAVGGTKQLITKFTPSNATNRNVKYSTDCENVIIKQSGDRVFVTPLTEQSDIQIKAESLDGNFVKYYSFDAVSKVAPKSFLVDASLDLQVGLSHQINVVNSAYEEYISTIYYDSNKLTYQTLNSSIAEVTPNGVIKAKATGSTVVKVSNGSSTKSINVNVSSNSNPVINPTGLTLSTSKECSYIEQATNQDTNFRNQNKINLNWGDVVPSDQNVIYSSSDPMIAIVDNNGYVNGFRKEGTTTITVISVADPSISANIDVEVRPVIASSISVEENEIVIEKGCTKFLNPKVLPENTTNKRLIAEASSNIVTVYSNGQTLNVFGNEIGSCKIKVSTESNPSVSLTYTVNVIERGVINADNATNFFIFVRKSIGHFLLFLFDGIFTTLGFYYLFENKKKSLIITLSISVAVGIFIAALSEFIQIFIPGRSGTVKDALIDIAGYSVAVLILLLIGYIKSKSKKKKSAENQDE